MQNTLLMLNQKCCLWILWFLHVSAASPGPDQWVPLAQPRTGAAVQAFWTVSTKSRQQAIQKTSQIPKSPFVNHSLLHPWPNLKELQLSRAVSAVHQPSVRSCLTGSLFSKPSGCFAPAEFPRWSFQCIPTERAFQCHRPTEQKEALLCLGHCSKFKQTSNPFQNNSISFYFVGIRLDLRHKSKKRFHNDLPLFYSLSIANETK